MRFLKLVDDSIQFIRKGLPPTEVPGYEVDEGDPYIFHPILPPCKSRTFKHIEMDCCPSGRNIRVCLKYNYVQMTAQCCIDCANQGKHDY